MSTLNQRIAELIPTMGGWCSVQKAQELALAVLKSKAQVVVELGVFEGRSCLPVAMALKEQGSGVIWAIDPWSNESAKEGYDGENEKWWGSVDLESVHQKFLSHIEKTGVHDYVRVLRRKSDDVIPPHEIDLLHLDGQHTDQTIKDVERYASKVKCGGFVFVDDLQWVGGGVGRAVEKLLTMGFVKLFDRDTGAMFERVPMNRKHVKKAAAKKRKKK